MKGKGSKIKAFLRWLDECPHLDESENIINRAGLLEICLGIGFTTRDAQLIQFTEGDHSEGTPDFIVNSVWGINEFNAFQNYIDGLHTDIESSRYVCSSRDMAAYYSNLTSQ